jgi:hypothetical protein
LALLVVVGVVVFEGCFLPEAAVEGFCAPCVFEGDGFDVTDGVDDVGPALGPSVFVAHEQATLLRAWGLWCGNDERDA